jgi:hypothetical protein
MLCCMGDLLEWIFCVKMDEEFGVRLCDMRLWADVLRWDVYAIYGISEGHSSGVLSSVNRSE